MHVNHTTRMLKAVALAATLAALAVPTAHAKFDGSVTPNYGLLDPATAVAISEHSALAPPVAQNTAASARPTASGGGLDWGDVGVGAGIGIGFVVLTGAATLMLLRWRNSGERMGLARTAATR